MDHESQGMAPLATSQSPSRKAQKGPKQGREYSTRRKLLCCCGVCSAIAVVLLIILIILIFTVFRKRDPSIRVKSVTLDGLKVNIGNIFADPDVSLDVDLTTTVSVRNPNYAGFKYKNTTAYIFYQGQEIADSVIPPGEVKARKTSDLSTTTSVHLSGSLINANLTRDLSAGVLPLVTTVQIKGTAKIINIFEIKNVKTNTRCDIDIFISNQTVGNHCKSKVKL